MSIHTKPSPSVSELPLLGRSALVTGATRGIGAAIARRLDTAGARVILAGRNRDALESVAGELTHDPHVLSSDLKRPDAPEELLRATLDLLGESEHLEVLVNNAGVSQFLPSGKLTAQAVDDLLAVNLRAVLLLAGHAAAHMADSGGGSIVNVSSVLGAVGAPASSSYAATKGALDALTRALAVEWGAGGVRVNAVAPGITRTDMIGGLLSIEGWEQFYSSQTTLQRVGEPVDVAEAVAFLASDAASYITGQTIVIDGGWATAGQIVPGR